MRWKPDLNLTTNARIFTALYIGAAFMMPPMMGVGDRVDYGTSDLPQFILVLCTVLLLPPVGGYVAGRIAGPGHGVRAAILAYLFSRSALIMNKLFWDAHLWGPVGLGLSIIDVAITSFVPCVLVAAAAQLAERHSARVRVETTPDGGRRWHVAALVLLLFLAYTHTLGGRLAARKHDPTGEKHFQSFPAGAYAGLATGGLDDCEIGPMYYSDPTGMVLIGWWDIPHCKCGDRMPPLEFLGL